MTNIILGLDLDGVLYPFQEALYTYYQYVMNYQGTYQQFWQELIPSFSPEKVEYIMSLPMPYEMTSPSNQVYSFLNFAKDNSEIYYLTHRPASVVQATKRYLKKYDFPFQDNLVFTGDKVTACRMFGVTHFLDDFSKQVREVSKVADAFLMGRMWNRDAQDELKTVYSLQEFKDAVFSPEN